MKINLKVRFKNPIFIANLAMAILLPILTYMGLSWEDMTTWAALGEVFVSAIQNPVVVVSVIVSVWNALNDPTTAGVSDSTRAMAYTAPNKE